MSVSLTEVINSAGYDPANNIEDAEWFFAQYNDYDELASKAQELLDTYDDYKDYCDERDGLPTVSFEEWLNDES